MTEAFDPNAPVPGEPKAEKPVTVREILRENWVLRRSLIFFILMLFVPLMLAWGLGWFSVANP